MNKDEFKAGWYKAEEKAKAFYLGKPFYAGIVVGAIVWQVVRWIF